MPSYSWTCHVCDHENQPNMEYCTSCGFPAVASGAEIESARAARLSAAPPQEAESERSPTSPSAGTSFESSRGKEDASAPSVGQSLFVVSFGLYLLLGAYFAWRDAKWPIFMPPQLDLIGLLLGAFVSPLGAYLGASFLALLGGACVVVPLLPRRKTDA
jgi:hypothetical protein